MEAAAAALTKLQTSQKSGVFCQKDEAEVDREKICFSRGVHEHRNLLKSEAGRVFPSLFSLQVEHFGILPSHQLGGRRKKREEEQFPDSKIRNPGHRALLCSDFIT